MDNKELRRKIDEEGYIHSNVIFEVIGNPKEYVEKAIREYVESLEKDEDIDVVSKDIEDAEKQEEQNVWSTFAEVELLVKNLEKFTWLCMNFMPSSIEIMDPEKHLFQAADLTNWLNDLLAKLHEIGSVSQQVGQQNKLMLKNINALMRNSILICLDADIRELDKIASKIGVDEKNVERVLKAMAKEGKITKKEEEFYRR